MPRRIAASATRLPILPRPMIPSVCPGSSEPANCFLPSSTCASNSAEALNPRTKSRAGARLRAASSMPARTSSFTALAFAPGALNTGTPRFDSAATGMLFTPRISHFLARALAMLGFEFLHVLDEPLYSLQRHRVVDRRAHAADRAVSLQLDHAAVLRALEEGIVEPCIRESERHVHPRAVFLGYRIPVEAA